MNLRKLFYKEQCEVDEDGLRIYENNPELVVDWWLAKIKLIEMEAFRKGQQEERQFILNILDGIDIVDEQMGMIGGTKAIRHALQSRII